MHTTSLLLLPLAAALSIVSQVKSGQAAQDLQIVNKNINTLRYAVGNWTEQQTIIGALPILSDEQTLDQSINSATSNAQQSPQLTSDEATAIGSFIENNIIPNTYALLLALEAKKQDFTDVGALSIVQNSIAMLRADQATYSSALLNITPPANQPQGTADASTIDGYFAEAVTYFSS